MGILNSGCKIEVAKETSQMADTVVLNNVAKMASRTWRYATQGMWLINHDVLPQLIILETANGGAVWQQALTDSLPPLLLGRPVAVTEHAKKVGDAGDIICCNWSQYLEGQMQPLKSAESMHVRFVNHERTFKFWVRNAGTPWWDAALTPKNGATQSPFVTLAARA